MDFINTDYHFHPNLPKDEKKAILKAKNCWKEFQKNNINCILVTEHSFKNPERAYEIMYKTKPKNCFCFPGIEYLTKSGSELILFSFDEKIYDISKLNKTLISIEEVIDVLKKPENKNIAFFIPHPYHAGTCSVINNKGYPFYKKVVNEINAVEISNGSYDVLNIFLELKFFKIIKKIFKKKSYFIKKTTTLPKKDYPKKIKFLACGSDAHVVSEIGNYYKIKIQNNKTITKKEVFKLISNNKGKGICIIKTKKLSLSGLLKISLISYSEYKMKNKFKKAYKQN